MVIEVVRQHRFAAERYYKSLITMGVYVRRGVPKPVNESVLLIHGKLNESQSITGRDKLNVSYEQNYNRENHLGLRISASVIGNIYFSTKKSRPKVTEHEYKMRVVD